MDLLLISGVLLLDISTESSWKNYTVVLPVETLERKEFSVVCRRFYLVGHWNDVKDWYNTCPNLYYKPGGKHHSKQVNKRTFLSFFHLRTFTLQIRENNFNQTYLKKSVNCFMLIRQGQHPTTLNVIGSLSNSIRYYCYPLV